MAEDEEQEEHGIDSAFYTWVGPGMLWPHLICLCKFKAFGKTWEEAGAELDEHLKEHKESE